MSGPHVVVVGGGLAGLSAALGCADGGVRVTLLEARNRLGGAVSSFRRHGMAVDNGQHVFLRCCTAYRRFLRRIGAEGSTVLQRRLEIPVGSPDGVRATLRRDGLPAPFQLARSLGRYPFLGRRDRLRIGRATLALARLDPDDPRLDRRTFGEWLREQRQSPAAVRSLWELIALPTLNLPADEASLALAVRVFRTALLEDRDAADVGYARVPLDEAHGRPAGRTLRGAGAEVRLGSPVRDIAVLPGGRFATLGDGWEVEADAVIVAVPHSDAASLLPGEAVPDPDRLRLLGRSPIVNLHVVYDRQVTSLPFFAGVGTPVQWVFDRTEAAGLGEGQYLAVSLSGADPYIDRRTADLRAEFVPALAELFGEARRARVLSFFVTRERAATFRQAPGTRALRPGPKTGIPRLCLAGAWTDTGWPATMEGAVRSGCAAAREVLVSLGRAEGLAEEAAA